MGYPFSNRDELLASAVSAQYKIAKNYFPYEVSCYKVSLKLFTELFKNHDLFNENV